MRKLVRATLVAAAAGAVAVPAAIGVSARHTPATAAARTASGTPFFVFRSSAYDGMVAQVSSAGNVIGLETPFGYEHLAGGQGEGYVLCYTRPDGSRGHAWDVGASSGGFGAPTATQSPAKVVRTTSDGLVQLVQNFTFSGSRRTLDIGITITNQSHDTVRDVVFRRQVDVDLDGGGPQGWAQPSKTWNVIDSNYAYTAVNAPDTAPAGKDAHTLALRATRREAEVVRVTTNPVDSTCEADSQLAPGAPVQGNDGGTLQYEVGDIRAGKSEKYAPEYLRF